MNVRVAGDSQPRRNQGARGQHAATFSSETPTDAFVRFGRAGGELEHLGSLVSQTPAVQDFTVTLLKVVKLQRVGRVQQPAERGSDVRLGTDMFVTPGGGAKSPLVHVVLLSLPLPRIRIALVGVAVVVGRGFAPRVGVIRVSTWKFKKSK